MTADSKAAIAENVGSVGNAIGSVGGIATGDASTGVLFNTKRKKDRRAACRTACRTAAGRGRLPRPSRAGAGTGPAHGPSPASGQ